MPATIARPRPAPALPRSRPPSARQKRSNSASASSAGSPGPWSRTSRTTASRRRARDVHLDRRAGRRVHERVAQQVGEHLAQLVRVAARRSQRGSAIDVDVAVGRGGARVVDGVAGEPAEVDVGADRVAHLVEARERQQVLDQHAHARRLVLDARHRLLGVLGVARRADAEQLGVAADRRQRRAQLVRGVGEEAAQPVLAGLALGERLARAGRASR